MVFSILFGGAKADKPWLLEEPSEEVKQQATTYGREEEYYPALRKRLEEQEAYARGQGASDYLAQERLAEDYQRTLRGEGISLAEQQMRAGQAQAMQQAAQMAASSRGGTAGLMMAQRSAQQQAALGTAGVARDAAMLRAKEVAEARGGLGQLSTAMRGMSQEQLRAYMQAQENIDKMQLEGSIAFQRDASGLAKAQAEQETKAAQATAERRAQMTGKVVETASKLAAAAGGGG